MYDLVAERALGSTGSGSGATQSIPILSNCTPGNTLILSFACRCTSISGVAVTDSKGNAWTVDEVRTNNNFVFIASTRQNVGTLTTSDTITVTFGVSAQQVRIWILNEYTGLLTSGYVDQTQHNENGTSVTAANTGTTALTTQSEEIAVAAYCISIADATVTGDAAWLASAHETIAQAASSDGFPKRLHTRYKRLTSTGTQINSITYGSAATYEAVIVTYKAVSSVPTAFPFTPVLTFFPGANEDPLSESGKWLGPIQNGVFQAELNTNEAAHSQNPSLASPAQSYWTTQFGPNIEAYATMSVVPVTAGHAVAVWGRIQNPGNASTMKAYIAVYTAGTGWRVYRCINGSSFTQLGSTVASPVPSNGHKFGIEVIGTQIKLWYYNGTSWSALITTSDTQISGSGYIGLEFGASTGTARLDAFGGGTSSSGRKKTMLLLEC
jgi:hypothetical protein